MMSQPRLALMGPPGESEPGFAALALLAGLTCQGWRVQHFRSRACLSGAKAVEEITGLPSRHLDAWLMSESMCRDFFLRGSRSAQLAIVGGPWTDLAGNAHSRDSAACPACRCGAVPAGLSPLIEYLDLPKVAVVPCPRLANFHLPAIADDVDAILLDGLEDPSEADRLRRLVEFIVKRPIVGVVEAAQDLRAKIQLDQPLDEREVERLARVFLPHADLNLVQALADRAPLSPGSPSWLDGPPRRFRVAFAWDEAFSDYFPDSLETLKAFGAELIDFSPLRDEALPEDADLVLIGSGRPERYAQALARNHSMISALRAHACRGQRIYAEGDGVAYLSQAMVIQGQVFSGAGILPVEATLRPGTWGRDALPVQRILTRDSWLGPSGTEIRGYLSTRWSLGPAADPTFGDCPKRSGSLTRTADLIFQRRAVGSLVQLHLPSLPAFIPAFAHALGAGVGV